MRWYYIERRCWPRITINAPGTIINISRGLRITSTVRCRIIDISQGGAQIETDSAVIEDDFYLEMDSEPDNRTTCSVVWRKGNRVGVKFII